MGEAGLFDHDTVRCSRCGLPATLLIPHDLHRNSEVHCSVCDDHVCPKCGKKMHFERNIRCSGDPPGHFYNAYGCECDHDVRVR